MRLVPRIILALALVNSVAVGIGVVIFLARYESIVSELQVSRIAVTAQAVKTTIESQLALGMQLRDAHDVGSVVVRAARRDAELEAMLVYDPDGRVLFANREAWLAQPVPPPAVGLLRGGGRQAAWREDAVGLVAVPLIDSFGEPAGGLLLRFSRAAPIAALARGAEQLLAGAVVILLGGMLLLGAAAYLAFRPLTRLAREAADGLEAMARDDVAVTLPASGWLARELQGFERDARQALAEIKEAESRLEKMPP